METWVLIIWMTGMSKGGSAAVPGYATQIECAAAGDAAKKAARVTVDLAFCIPGPRR